jgi:hypothetical protein
MKDREESFGEVMVYIGDRIYEYRVKPDEFIYCGFTPPLSVCTNFLFDSVMYRTNVNVTVTELLIPGG